MTGSSGSWHFMQHATGNTAAAKQAGARSKAIHEWAGEGDHANWNFALLDTIMDTMTPKIPNALPKISTIKILTNKDGF